MTAPPDAGNAESVAKSRPVVLQVARPSQGGMREHLDRLLRRLPGEGFDLQVASPGNAPVIHADVAATATRFWPVPIADRPHPLADIRAATVIARIIRDVRPRLVHAHGYRAGWVVSGALPPGLAFIVTAHNLVPIPAPFPARTALHLLSRRVDRWIAITGAMRDSLVRSGIHPSRIAVIPNGIDASSLSPSPGAAIRIPLGIPEGVPLVAVVARLEPAKGVEDALHAFALLLRSRPEARLLIAGDGPDRERLVRLSETLLLTNAVVFAGWRRDATALLAASDACLIPSRSEGQSLVALEAMALGTPTVATRVGGLPEMIRDAETGLLVPARDAPAMARALERLLDDPFLADRIRTRAANAVRNDWTEDRMIDRIADLYRRLLQ